MATGMLEKQPATKPQTHDPLWFKDAVIYQLHVRAFCDATGDGVGDFRGLTEKLDYIEDLGRHHDLVVAVFSFAAAGRRLRHRRLHAVSIRLTGVCATSRRFFAKPTAAICA